MVDVTELHGCCIHRPTPHAVQWLRPLLPCTVRRCVRTLCDAAGPSLPRYVPGYYVCYAASGVRTLGIAHTTILFNRNSLQSWLALCIMSTKTNQPQFRVFHRSQGICDTSEVSQSEP